jgi:TonB-linked SusC/RagA family outer membrane protein
MSPREVRARLLAMVVTAIAVASVCSSRSLAAQGTGTVRGTVVESSSRRPIADVQVTVVGSSVGAVTGSDGTFRVSNVPQGDRVLRVRRLGFIAQDRTVSVPLGQEVTTEFTLVPSPTQLEQLVITGTAGAAEKRTVANAVSTVNVAELTERQTVLNVSEVLTAKAPGLVIQANTGTPGTSSEIVLRGYGSLTANRPVVFIDGVRINTENLGNFIPSGAGATNFSGNTTSALDMINPNDIESVEVLKGPAASTLYGADAAGGVIQIITKKGTRGQQQVRWNARSELGRTEWGVETLTNYMTCTQALIDARDAAQNPLWPGCQGKAVGTVLSDDPFKRDPLAMRDGKVRRFSVSARGGGDRFSYYVAGDADREEGIFYNSENNRRATRTNFTLNPVDAVDIALNVGYLHNNLRLPLGDEAFNGLLLSAARGLPGRLVSRPSLAGWGSVEPSLANKYNNRTKTDRLTIGTTTNYNPFSWFRNRFTAGMDWSSGAAQILSAPGDIDVPAGFIAQRTPRVYNYTLDYNGNAIWSPVRAVQLTTSFGTQLTSQQNELLSASGTGLASGDQTNIGSAVSRAGDNTFSEFNSLGFYVQEQVAWRDRMFLTAAVRADDHSSFGTDFDAVYYPKLGLSWVLSDEPALEGIFRAIRSDNFRVRTAWGQAGRAPAPYSAVRTYLADRVAKGTAVEGAIRTGAFGNPDLKPEKGSEIEAGFDASFINGRAGIEATYYNKDMRDLLTPLALPPSTGFNSSPFQNLGKTRNYGLELSVTGTPLQRQAVTWDVRLNGSWNKNKLVTIDSLITDQSLAGASYNPGMQRNRVGFPLGAYFIAFPRKDASGNYIIANNTLALEPTTQYVGAAIPTRLLSLANTFTLFRDIRVYTLLDYQGGHWLYNHKEYDRCFTRANCERLNSGTLNDTTRASYRTQASYIEQADFLKLREVSVSYTVPSRLTQRVSVDAVQLTLTGRNLTTWTDYTGLDPEVSGYGANQQRNNQSSAIRADAYPMPQTRRMSFAINLTF